MSMYKNMIRTYPLHLEIYKDIQRFYNLKHTPDLDSGRG